MPAPTVVDWMLQAMEAIAQAHSYGVVHGDLTLARMFVTRSPEGTPCIQVDFGPRTMTLASVVSGASGPHVRGDVDVSPDVRALGAALDRLLFAPSSGRAVPFTEVPSALELVVRRCLERRPNHRFAGVAELARALTPFGTPAARVSCERVECLLEDRVVELTRSKPHLEPPLDPRPELRAGPPPRVPTDWPRPYAAPASGKVVFLALAMMVALGAAVFVWLYWSVPRDQPPAYVGVMEQQPSTASRGARAIGL
jgi:hypothetical protein